jgi:hypothetical protein
VPYATSKLNLLISINDFGKESLNKNCGLDKNAKLCEKCWLIKFKCCNLVHGVEYFRDLHFIVLFV